MRRRRWSSERTADRVVRYLRERADEHGITAVSWEVAGLDLAIGRQTFGTAVARLIDTGEIAIARMGTGRDYPTEYDVFASKRAGTKVPA